MNSEHDRQERVAAIKAAYPLSSVIGQHVQLKRSGRELRGCCPFHQDRTPSFYVNDEKGTYHCFGCGAGGDVINFVSEYNNMSFFEACDHLTGEYIGDGRKFRSDPHDDAKRLRTVRRIWDECKPIEGTPASAYLESRCLPLEYVSTQANLRYGELSFEGSEEKYPALVAAARNLAGEVMAIQRTYLTRDGKKLGGDCKRSLGAVRGAAIRFTGPDGPSPNDEHIFLTEGVEDALSVARIIGQATVWATLGTANMLNVELPEGCSEATIAHDSDEAGRFAALDAKIMFVKKGMFVNLYAPDEFKDWNEFLVYWERDTGLRHYNELPWLRSCHQMNEELFQYEEGLDD